MPEASALPLRGAHVLVTRASSQAGPLSGRLRELGAKVIELPLISIEPVGDTAPLDAALKSLDSYDWVIFTSANGVEAVLERLGQLGMPVGKLGDRRVAAIGPATAAAVKAAGLSVQLMPDRYLTTAILDSFRSRGVIGQRLLLPRADRASPELADGLVALGAHVDGVVAYRTVASPKARLQLPDRLARREIDLISLASASTLDSMVEAVDGKLHLLSGVALVCIGPVTADAARRYGLSVDAVAEEHSLEGLVGAAIRTWAARPESARRPEAVA